MQPKSDQVYKQRRAELMKRIGPKAVAIVHSSPDPGHARYQPAADLVYLTGLTEPDSTVVLKVGADDDDCAFHLFVRERNPERERWDGLRTGTEGAITTFGADFAYPSTDLQSRLAEILSGSESVHFNFGESTTIERLIVKTNAELRKSERIGKFPFEKMVDLRTSLHEMRLVKDKSEVELLRKATAITEQAHRRAMALAAPGLFEYQLEAAIAEEFRGSGGNGAGYQTIVGGGNRANILHYIENTEVLEDGTLVLIDAGCDFRGYTADVTRTIPVSGAFSPAQKQCYQGVLDVQKSAIEMVRPGITLLAIHEHCVAKLAELMVTLGLLEGPAEERIADTSYKNFYMHRTSHWLGMDVHDVGAYCVDGSPRPLQSGMVITIEPGIYIDANAAVPVQFRGIGVRIEDDILVTDEGFETLSSGIPKELAEVEAACVGNLGDSPAP